MLLSLFIFTFSLSASADQNTNPYSQYQSSGYGNFQQYKPVDASSLKCDDPNWDGNCVCDQQKQKNAWVQNHGQALNSFNWSKVRSKQLTVIGDAHGISNPDSLLDLIKLSRSDSSKQCVFFEISADWSSDQFLKLVQEKTGDPRANQLRRYYGKIANGAIAQGFKAIMVDDPRNWSGDRNVSDFDRETFIAAKIKNLFSSKQCDHAVLVVGKAHVSNRHIADVLNTQGISTATLNPIFAPNEGRKGPTEEWNGLCTKETYSPSEALIFENSGIKDDWVTPGFDPVNRSITFGNFDYSVLFPEPQFEVKVSTTTVQAEGKKTSGIQ